MSENTQELLARLTSLHPKSIDLSLDRMYGLLAALGNPQHRVPPVIHVAGTNGKGSTLSFMRAILEACGYRVHVYTSPHLVAFNERIRLAQGLVDCATLNRALDACETANAGAPVTFFEITTAAAFLCFAQEKADILLLETGLGGRLDATNVIERPLVTAITPVSMDHMRFLGDTQAAIAKEKAGILKPGVPAVLAPQPSEALVAITDRAKAVGAPLYCHGRAWSIDEVVPPAPAQNSLAHNSPAPALTYRGQRWTLDLPRPSLTGVHQHINAGLAIACLENLAGFDITPAGVARGVAQAQWPGRLQKLGPGTLVDRLPKDWQLWVDGGHNPAAACALAHMAATWRDRPLALIYGMINSKDIGGFLSPLAPFVARACAIAVPGESASFSAEAAAAAGRRVGLDVEVGDDLDGAINRLIRGGPPGRILVCGSLYMAGAVLAANATATT